MPIPESILYLTESDVQQTLSVAKAVDLAEEGIVADANGSVAGNKFYMDVGSRGFIKPFSGYMAGEDLAYVKTFSYFPRNPADFGRGTTSSMVILFDSETGLPTCVMEAGWVTALKTGASSAVTASYLARPGAERAVIFGAGTLGRMHLRALSHRFRLRHASVIDILPEVAAQFASELEPEVGFPVEAVALGDRERVVRQADIVFTVTTGNQALVELDWLRPGAFVGRLGSYQEIALDVITGADKLVVDSWAYVRPRIPELALLAEQRQFGFDDVYAEWPEIVARRKPGRESPNEIIVYIALGIWGEYAAILPEVFRHAVKLGIGQKLNCT
jgi:ornithine cyclodeaminase/alanine dehydrogenase-like protein (mu-crystallin family)